MAVVRNKARVIDRAAAGGPMTRQSRQAGFGNRLSRAAWKRHPEELEWLDVQSIQEKTRVMDPARDETLRFPDLRLIKTSRGKWGVRTTPGMKARAALLRKLKDVLCRHIS